MNNGQYEEVLIESFYSSLAGVTFENRQLLVQKLFVGQELILKRIPDNPYDCNAIAVYDSYSFEQVGFIKKYVAANLAPVMDREDRKVYCMVKEITGGKERFLGVNILIKIFERKAMRNETISENPFKTRTMYFSRNNEGTFQLSTDLTDNLLDDFKFNSLKDVINSDF